MRYSLSLQGQRLIDTALYDIRTIEYTVISNRTELTIDWQALEEKVRAVTPQIFDLGKDAIPYLVQKLRHPNSSDMPLSFADAVYEGKIDLSTEHGRTYIAHWIDGLSDLEDVDHILEAMRIDRILFSANHIPADILLGTIQRLVYPMRLLKEQGKALSETSKLDAIAERLILILEAQPRGNDMRNRLTDSRLFHSLAFTGTKRAHEFVGRYAEKIDSMPTKIACQKLLTNFDHPWDQLLHYQFSGALNHDNIIYRLKRDTVRYHEQKKLQLQARAIFGLPLDDEQDSGDMYTFQHEQLDGAPVSQARNIRIQGSFDSKPAQEILHFLISKIRQRIHR